MKIAVISSGHIPSFWAHSINTVKHANAFHELGHHCEIFSPKRHLENQTLRQYNPYELYDLNSKVRLHLFCDKSPNYFREDPKLKRLIKFIHRKIPSFNLFLSDPEKKIAQEILKSDFDLSYCRTYRSAILLLESNFPTIIETHHPNPAQAPQLKKIISFSNKKNFLGLVTIHEKIKEQYIKLGLSAKKIKVLEDAVDIQKFDQVTETSEALRKQLNLPLDKTIIMYCGSLKAGKGIKKIINTAKNCKQNSSILFEVIGGTSDEVSYWKEIAAKNSLNNINFRGFIENSRVPLFLKSSDILFMPYDLSEKQSIMDLETTSPIKLFEYMAAKKIIITTKIPTIEKIVSEKEAILIDSNEESYSEKILEISQNLSSKHLDKLREYSYQKSKVYSYKKRCQQILSLYDDR